MFETGESMVKLFLAAGLFAILGGCAAENRTGAGISVSPSSYLRPPQANTAPRGSPEFCRIYGQQTADNRLRMSSGFGGRGPRGMDFANARLEGERAAARCASGRLN